jgi:hypothetical protein
VTFCSGGCAIAGTFTEAADPVATALLIPGGGKSDRNSDARLWEWIGDQPATTFSY